MRLCVFFPLPQEQQIFDVALDVTPVKDMKVSGEFARSMFDPNRFSVTRVAQSGHALNFSGTFTPREIKLLGMDIGGI